MPFNSKTAKAQGKKTSRKGVPNKNTSEIREAYQLLVDSKLPELSTWLDRVAEDHPEKALDLIIKISDFIIPKLQRTEIKGELTLEQLLSLSPQERKERILELRNQLK